MMLDTLIGAARQAGAHLLHRQADLARVTVESKGRNDFVTVVDRECEDLIVACLDAAHPGVPVLAEESDLRKAGGGERWIIDPLDGTTNFLHRYPCFSVSIARQSEGKIVAGVVFDPVRDELYAAERDGGATLNGKALAVSSVQTLAGALLGTGFPFKIIERLETYLAGFRLLLHRSSGLRRNGSAALDLCYVAAGRLDGFWEFGLAPWDVAAGALIVREAGGQVTDAAGGRNWLEGESIVAATPAVHADIVAALGEVGTSAGGPSARGG